MPAEESLVSNFVAGKREPDRTKKCRDCKFTAKWEVIADGETFYACDGLRRTTTFTAKVYRERRL